MQQNQATRLRQKLNKFLIERWEKLGSVETMVTGTTHINEAVLSRKRQQAQTIAFNTFKDVMTSLEAYTESKVSIALMVQGLGETIEFGV
jgi:hypothetical protein